MTNVGNTENTTVLNNELLCPVPTYSCLAKLKCFYLLGHWNLLECTENPKISLVISIHSNSHY